MSSRRRRRSPLSPSPAAADEQEAVADDLVSRLRVLLPPGPAAANGGTASTAQVLEETCVYIRRLHAEVDGLAERLAQRLEHPPAGGHGADDAAQLIIRALLT